MVLIPQPDSNISNLNLGGLADSQYTGARNSVAAMQNLDIHSESGLIKCNQALKKDSGNTIDDLVLAIVDVGTTTYFFGSTNGKVWSRDASGTYALVGTVAPAAGDIGITGAYYDFYNDVIYYAMGKQLGKWTPAAAWTTRNDAFATFHNGISGSLHPFIEVNQVIYIGDYDCLAQIDGTTFSAQALMLPHKWNVTSLGYLDTELLVGAVSTAFGAGDSRKTIGARFRWDTYSVSFNSMDIVQESGGITSFLQSDNYLWWTAGYRGAIYQDNGKVLSEYKVVPGVYDPLSAQSVVHYSATESYNGKTLFGVSNYSGNPAPCGIYSLARTNNAYPFILNLEYVISTGNTSNVVIGAIKAIDDTTFMVSWSDSTGGTTVYGIDIVDTANKATGRVTTRSINMFRIFGRRFIPDRTLAGTFGYVYVPYRSLPTGTSIGIWYKANNGTLTQVPADQVIVDAKRQLVFTKTVIARQTNTLQFEIVLNPSGNNAPEVESAGIWIQ